MVLEADWSTGVQTVRLTEISSAPGTATIPSMTQTPGTKFDVPICHYTVASGTNVIASFLNFRFAKV
jgi:hypothetical protein